MHYTLHLTNRCNLRCTYCYADGGRCPAPLTMTRDTARAAVDLAASSGTDAGLIFFGGEPLLERDLIEGTIAYAESVARARPGFTFFYKATTNGTLLDDAFLDLADAHDMFLALSIDGTRAAHDRHRMRADGSGSYDAVCDAAQRLLARKPHAPAMMTVSPDVVSLYEDGVRALFDIGFQYVIASLDFSAHWTRAHLRELKRQYQALAELYYEKTRREERFYLSPFEVKISSHIHSRTYCHERCELGLHQLSVAADGGLYPCVQFVGDERYRVGDVARGIDEARRAALYRRNEAEKDGCAECAIRARCNHHCGCLNKQTTGSIDEVSPVLCAHERIVLPIADALAARLYREQNGLFIQKQYNALFPAVSLAERT